MLYYVTMLYTCQTELLCELKFELYLDIMYEYCVVIYNYVIHTIIFQVLNVSRSHAVNVRHI